MVNKVSSKWYFIARNEENIYFNIKNIIFFSILLYKIILFINSLYK